MERVGDGVRSPSAAGAGTRRIMRLPDFEPALYARQPPSALGASRPESVLPHKGGGVVRVVLASYD
jgi:hypothetical protein